MKNFIKSIITALAMVLAAGTALAGGLDAPAAPTDPGSAMYTGADIYNRLTTGAAGVKRSGPFAEPTAGPAAGGHTLDEIMAIAPVADNTNGAAVTDVLSGKTFWGLRTDGTWGLKSGAMTNNGAVTITPGTAAQTIAAGYHNGSGSVAGDANLVTGNIRSGVSIFGVAGNTNVVDTREDSAPAAAANISNGKKAYVNGALVTGAMSGSGYPCATGLLSPLGRWCDNSDGTVRDMTTGLIWLQDAGWGGQYPWWASLTSTTTAFDRVSFVQNGTPATLTDGSAPGAWRLPTKNEFVALTTGTEYIRSSAIYKFTSVQSGYYWSSSSYDTVNAWFVYMDYGVVTCNNKIFSYYVWPVRSGQ